ncbi:MAG: cyclic nucleotide-binding domain-containing protein [Thermodesulfobacteriota bacterium]|nr:cyclic nucleotide-binding domain-containing protein [Thermodesulfobacteriota bacterium]
MKIAGSFRRCSYPLGATLVEQNHSVKLLGFIKSGSACRVAQGKNDKGFICGSLGRGEFFGAGAALIDENAFVGVQCREPMVCYVQAKDDFRRMVNTFSQILDFFIKTR